ncbi:uncharacterized protein LOC142332611 isoform X2 [Lycorma delicatula]
MATLKKSAGYGTPTKRGQLRSPTIKRPLSAPVTMQGWLHKQGSDGLMLWKKRWFVLSEYCLFYYKGPEEEKLLGSILLPSYRISPCSSEDRVYRKFSFKAEHANMRTYYFAADSHQSMSQWMNALSLASILQESNSWEEHRSGASTGSSHRNPSTEDSDSGFHGGGTTLRQPISNQTNISGGSNNENTGCTTPSNNNWNNNSNNNQLTVGGYQPLYANAPPKPRRLNNDSSSTERSPERNNSEDCSSGGGGRLSRMIVQQPQDYNVRNERPYYYNAQHSQHSHHPPPPQLIIHPNNTLINNVQYCNNSCNNERRTPDTYGRSNTATPCNSIAQQQKCGKIIQSKLKNSDYEDIYQNNPDIIIQHQNNHHNIINTNTIPYTNQEIQYRRRRVDDHHLTVNSMNEKQRRFPPRPHSADFLEYDNRRYYNSPTPQSSSGNSSNHMFLSNNHHEQHNLVAGGNNTGNVISQHQQPQSQQPRRPKSSLDILHHGNFDGNLINSIDSYGYNYWSEESYARKMRQSSSYINPNNFQTNQNVSNSSRATTPSLRQQQLPTLPLIKTTQNITYDSCNSTNNANNEPAPNSVTMRNQSEFIQQQERRWSEYVESRNNMLSNSCSNNQFTRSASARLPRQHIIDDDDVSDRSYRQSYKRRNSSESSKDGTNKSQQREESMKRLLEWKQRMLQSPLTRKNSCSSTRGIAQNELNYYKQQVLRDLSNCDTTPVGTQHLAQSSIINQLKTSQTWDRLSSTTPDNEPWNSNTMPEFRPSRKKHSDDHNIRSSSGRSRSQDGRRSASILNQSRYTSYSSDDEEVEETRESRKRVRRSSQVGRTRLDSWDGKQQTSSQQQSSLTSTSGGGDYENINLNKTKTSKDHLSYDERCLTPSSNEIPPDSEYTNIKNNYTQFQNEISKTSSILDHPNHSKTKNDLLFNDTDKNDDKLSPSSFNLLYNESSTVDDNDLIKKASSSTGSYGDMDSNNKQLFSSKHSDSGYDTLKTSGGGGGSSFQSSDPEVRDLLKFRFDRKWLPNNDITVYPVQTPSTATMKTNIKSVTSSNSSSSSSSNNNNTNNNNSNNSNVNDNSAEIWGSKLDESRLIKEFSYQYIKSNKDENSSSSSNVVIDNENKTSSTTVPLSPSPPPSSSSSTKRFEIPPQNIVQDRIKVFETGKDEEIIIDKKDNVIINSNNTNINNKLKMQEPLKVSVPVYKPNEAHVSLLKNSDIKMVLGEQSFTDDTININKNIEHNKIRRKSVHGYLSCQSDDISLSTNDESKKNAKSVRDLLADFERKSSETGKGDSFITDDYRDEDTYDKRCVFSDTETLLYDTSSDAEGNSSSGTLLPKIRRPEMIVSEDDEEDRDEEVAAVLGKRDTFFSSCRDLGRKRETSSEHRKRKTSKSSVTCEPNDLEGATTSGYVRLSMAESLVTHEDLESHCSSPNNHHRKKRDLTPLVNDLKLTNEHTEEHYMPMTPSKKSVLAPNNGEVFSHTRSNSASQTLIMENVTGGRSIEESSYVEMTENGMIQSLLAPESNTSFLSKQDLQRLNSSHSSNDTACYIEIDPSKKGQHYEFLYRANSNNNPEPLYMEVSSLEEKKRSGKINEKDNSSSSTTGKINNDNNSTPEETVPKRNDIDGEELPPMPPRVVLPDILNSSTDQSNNQKQSSIKSDSSDADDEASKDLDSLDAPRHPRFSLSDTFRPASYYLGASMGERTLIGLNSEQQDSSDSDLVSPPPIPTSPPPMDDLETSLESSVEMKKSSPVQLKSEKMKDGHQQLWNPTPVLANDLQTIHERMERLSCIVPSNNHLDETLSSETESIESTRRDRLLKRRPVSADILNSLHDTFLHSSHSTNIGKCSISGGGGSSDLDSIGSRSRLAMDLEEDVSIDFDHYLEDLNGSNDVMCTSPLNFYNYRIYQNEKYNLQDDRIKMRRSRSVQDQPIGQSYINDNNDNSTPYGYEPEVRYENLQALFPPPPSAEVLEEMTQQQNQAESTTYVTSIQSNDESNGVSTGSIDNQQITENNEQTGAPYYYSDLLKNGECPNVPPNVGVHHPNRSSRNVTTLNNQRDGFTEIICSNKRNDVGRKVNQIHQSQQDTEEMMMDEAATLAHQLRTTSAQFLVEKTGHFDERNLYEADTLQRRKISTSSLTGRRSGSQTPDLHSHNHGNNDRNIYPHGIKDKSESLSSSSANTAINIIGSRQQPTTRRRSRSLEGLLDEPEFYGTGSNNIEVRQNRVVSPGDAISRLLNTTRPSSQQHQQTLRPSHTSMQNLSNNSSSRTSTATQSRAPPPPPDVWEEDALWRENLRRVSLRHTRSLDDLDRDTMMTTTSKPQPDVIKQQSQQQLPTSSSGNREVMYVNGSFVNRSSGRASNQREYEEDYREGRPRGLTRPSGNPSTSCSNANNSNNNNNSSTDVDDDVHYERLVRDSSESDRARRGQTYIDGYVWDEEHEIFRKGDKTIPSRDQPRKQTQPFLDIGWYPTRPPSFEIDREKLRQWDLMSSAPAGMLGAGRPGFCPSLAAQIKGPSVASNNIITTTTTATPTTTITTASVITTITTPTMSTMAATQLTPQQPHADLDQQPVISTKNSVTNEENNTCPQLRTNIQASGSGSVIGRDPLPPRVNNAPTVVDKPPPLSPSPLYVPPPGPILRQPDPDLSHKRVDGPGQWNLHMSAGELLGRTHEELVLLLIQLRRQSAGFCKAMEACHMEIEAQARLAELETPKRLEHLQKLEDLKRHLLDLEKQYEKGKPLVNLVDNMVKLGSLCRVGAPFTGQNGAAHGLNGSSPLLRERLEFNHKVQEQRLLAEERRDWQRLSPDHNQLQAKVAQLYRLDRLLQEESGTLYSLQQDKEMLERALGGLRHKLQGIHGNPAEAERYRRQQRLLERELTRVRSILAHNSKKLEETVAENARLEQELVILRQKLQTSRRVPDSSTGPTTAALEAELRRVQTLVGDLQRQRQELSLQVRQLTEKSHSLSQQIRPGPTGIAGAGPILGKKRAASSWLETDLDSQVTRDLGLESPPTTTPCGRHSASPIPLYVNTEDSKSVSPTNISSTNSETPSREDVPPPPPPQPQYCRPININEADDRVKRFYGIIPKDKPQEIKTVRIVKRESERRQRDRDRSGNIGIPITNSATNPKRINVNDDSGTSSDSNERSMLSRVMEEPSESPPPAPGRSDSVNVIKNIVSRQAKMKMDGDKSSLSAHEQLFGSVASLVSSEGGSPQLSPVYQSEAARQIVEEMAAASKVGGRRLVPREKRRHHTVSSGRPVLRIDTSYSAGGSRDDLDMERALRPRLNAPDVVRSTLSRVDTKFSSETIDNLLGTPGKILIPERYIPESTPELSMEEQERRLKKADAIRKMLSETTVTASDATGEENDDTEDEKSSTLKKKVAEEKRQREHLLQLSQIIAQQVMEKSKIVAVKALENLPLELKKKEEEDAENDEDLSPADPLPLYQQRDQFYS